MTREDKGDNVSDMTAVVTRSGSPISVQEWDELTIPDSYRAEIIQHQLAVYPQPQWQESGEAPPITVAEWEEVTVPEAYRAEVVQGELIVSPAPSYAHILVQHALRDALTAFAPIDARVLLGPEWRFGSPGLVAMAPQPDVVVVPRSADGVHEAPALAIEVLSRTDDRRLEAMSHLTRIEAKRIDYAMHGLLDYLEVDLIDGRPVVIRYENHADTLVEVDRAEGDETLVATRPFPYELVPARLLD